MTMKLDSDKIIPMLKGLGFINTSGQMWKKQINEKQYLIDFSKNQICRLEDTERIEVDKEDGDLQYVINMCLSAMFSDEEKEDLAQEEDNAAIAEECNPNHVNVPAVVVRNATTMQATDEDLTNENIRKYLCPSASDEEIFTFLKLCKHRNLNPFIKEAYLVKYGTTPATMIVAKDAILKMAEEHQMYDGFKAGIIIKNDAGELVYREGQFLDKGEHLLGGWADVYRKDRKIAIRSEVSMSEYGTGKSAWIKIPATMIRKVAVVQSHREAFPGLLGGCYDSSEIDETRRD